MARSELERQRAEGAFYLRDLADKLDQALLQYGGVCDVLVSFRRPLSKQLRELREAMDEIRGVNPI